MRMVASAMASRNHPWERRYAAGGYRDRDPVPALFGGIRLFEEHGCRSVLDLGCGLGRHAIHLARAGFAVSGADISGTALRLAATWAHEEDLSIPLALLDTRRGLPYTSAAFDAVWSSNVIHHALLDEVRLTIADIHRVLRPGGLAIVSVGRPAPEDPVVEVEPGTVVLLTGDEAGMAHHLFSERELREEFRAFEVLGTDTRANGIVTMIWARKPVV